MSARPTLRLRPGKGRRLRLGHPWAYSNEIEIDEAARGLAPGALVRLVDANAKPLGTACFNPHALIAARLLTTDPDAAIDSGFWSRRLARALNLRAQLFDAPYYRLVHAEADGFPGLAIDRYADALVLQINIAGMERALPELLAAVEAVLGAHSVVIRADGRGRNLEGLARYVRVARGALDGPVELIEGGLRFLADLESGQKTGWYFDQRDNRSFAARLAVGRRVLDLYCATGGFALACAAGGARETLGIDSSEPALALARGAARLNGLETCCRFERAKAFDALAGFDAEARRFGLVVADPPSFVGSRRQLKAGLRAYRKLARMAAGRVEPEGFLLIASCSYNVAEADFLDAVSRGLADAGRWGRILRRAGAGADHPIHPALPESAYLKCLVIELD